MQIQELKRTYDKMLNDIKQYIGESHIDEIKLWLMSAIFRIWTVNKLCSEDYVDISPVLQRNSLQLHKLILCR